MSDAKPAVIVKELYKSFKLPHEQHSGVKQLLINLAKRKKGYETQHVLDDVSFEIKEGEFFGIVGCNGSGKSTLLKLLAGIYAPDKGLVQVNGSLTPFIELGVGFNPELTGRENVFLNGALLGFSRGEMGVMYDDIVQFAELERFMDQKLKNYSSGMQVRLAFSIAIRAQGDVLILDEVLAVGDEAFQQKCFQYFDQLKKNKKTIVFVTHDMEAVKKYCDRALLLSNGKRIFMGEPNKAAEMYHSMNNEVVDAQAKKKNEAIESDLKVELLSASHHLSSRYDYKDEMLVKLSWPKEKKVTDVGVAILTSAGQMVFATNTFIDDVIVKENICTYRVNLNLGQGSYFVSAGTFYEKPETVVDFMVDGPSFIINKAQENQGDGLTRLSHKWE
jgi:ABC-2 type transport system ATP-binding protein